MAEYRKGSILARIEELENGNTELLRQIRQRPMEFGEVVVLVAVIDHNLTKIRLLEEIKAMVEARLSKLNLDYQNKHSYETIGKILELHRILEGEGGEKEKAK